MADDSNPAPLKRRRKAKGSATAVPDSDSKLPTVAADTSSKAESAGAEPTTEGPTPEATAAALAYLKQWEAERAAWKFNKVRQNFLLKWALDPQIVPKTEFPLLSKYFAALQGGAKTLLLDRITKQLAAEVPEVTDENDTAAVLENKIARIRAKRARKLQRLLS